MTPCPYSMKKKNTSTGGVMVMIVIRLSRRRTSKAVEGRLLIKTAGGLEHSAGCIGEWEIENTTRKSRKKGT
jgi:hypothetical protein